MSFGPILMYKRGEGVLGGCPNRPIQHLRPFFEQIKELARRFNFIHFTHVHTDGNEPTDLSALERFVTIFLLYLDGHAPPNVLSAPLADF